MARARALHTSAMSSPVNTANLLLHKETAC